MNWHDFFKYDNGSIFWLISTSKRVKPGDFAGTVNNKGYVIVTLNRKLYCAHRVIWEMHKGKIPEGMQIDHINHIRDDNRIENLRMVTNAENCRNRTKSNKGIGRCGVTWHVRDKVYQVHASINGKNTNIGNFKNLNDALMARSLAIGELDYHENHGKTVDEI